MMMIPEAWVAREASYEVRVSDEDASLFADGSPVCICTSWAIQARRILGVRAQIYGFFCADNPTATGMASLADGHDFAVLDGRWILDGWLSDVEGEILSGVIDMADPANADLIRSFYGDPARWERGRAIEDTIDNEPADRRGMALSGVNPPAAPSDISEYLIEPS